VTAQRTLKCAFNQFDSTSTDGLPYDKGADNAVIVNTFTHCGNEETASNIVRQASKEGALLVYTISDPEIRAKTKKMCELSNVQCVDLMGPLLNALSDLLGEAPLGTPGKEKVANSQNQKLVLTDNYYKRIEAVEFTLKADDGAAPWLLKDADVILVGVSRTGKTPLSVVIAQQIGLKVANVPLVLECPPPKELFEDCIDNKKVFCLTINPVDLKRIRLNRLERSGAADSAAEYADRSYLLRDLKNARELAAKNGWTEVDVTGRAVEETAGLISSIRSDLMGERRIWKM